MQIQNLTIKKFKPKKFRLKSLKPINRKTFILPYINKSKKTSYQKKKKVFKKKRD